MTPISSYASSNDLLRLLLQGAPGSGKTTTASQFPSAYIIDIDINLGGPLRFLGEKNLNRPIGFDVLDKDQGGSPILLPNRFARLDSLLLEAQKNDQIKTIVIDGGTGLIDILIAEVLRQQQKSEMSKREWGFFSILGKKFFSTLASMRKHVVLVVHEKSNKDEKGNLLYPIKVNWPGQVGDIIGAFFTNVWRCESKVEGYGVAEKAKFFIRTISSTHELKNSLGLPPTFEFKWDTIQTALDKGKEK